MPNLDKVPLNTRNVGIFPVYDIEITIHRHQWYDKIFSLGDT